MNWVYLVKHQNGTTGELLHDIRSEFGRVLLVYVRKDNTLFDSDNVYCWMIRECEKIELIPNYPHETIHKIMDVNKDHFEVEI